MNEYAKKLKALLVYVKGLDGKKLDVQKLSKELGISQAQSWAYISFALRTKLLAEPSGKGSRVYVVSSEQKAVAEVLKDEAIRLGMPTKTMTAAKTAAWTKANRKKWGLS